MHQDVKAAFTDKVLHLIQALKQGDPLDPATKLGPLARLDLAEGLERQLQKALAQGATLLCGGVREGCNFAPTLLDNVSPDSVAFREETFGPLATITSFSSEQEAIHLANLSRYGLSAAIWTQDLDKAKTLACQLEVGSVFVNAVVRSDSRLPIGGVKKIGLWSGTCGSRHQGILYGENPLCQLTERKYTLLNIFSSHRVHADEITDFTQKKSV
nr:aldehyde dehydrogenase family protein [Haliscomenobacter sp.]